MRITVIEAFNILFFFTRSSYYNSQTHSSALCAYRLPTVHYDSIAWSTERYLASYECILSFCVYDYFVVVGNRQWVPWNKDWAQDVYGNKNNLLSTV